SFSSSPMRRSSTRILRPPKVTDFVLATLSLRSEPRIQRPDAGELDGPLHQAVHRHLDAVALEQGPALEAVLRRPGVDEQLYDDQLAQRGREPGVTPVRLRAPRPLKQARLELAPASRLEGGGVKVLTVGVDGPVEEAAGLLHDH